MILVQWASPALGLLIAADIFAFLVVIYGGFAMNYVNGIQLWNSALLPVLYGVAGLWGGAGLTLFAMLATGARTIAGVEEWARIFLVSFILIVAIYLLSITYRGMAGKFSVREMVVGRWAPLFWVMVVALGMALPLGVVISSLMAGFAAVPLALLYVTILFELLGDLSLRYCILRSGFYSPIIPTKSYAY